MTSNLVSGKKVLFLIHSLKGGGAERTTIHLAAQWAKDGAHVSIATIESSKSRKYEVPSGVHYIPLDVAGGSRNPIYSVFKILRRFLSVYLLLRKEKPDVAIGMMTTSAILLAAVRPEKTFTIGAERNYPPKENIGNLWRILRKKLYKRLNAITVQTNKGKDWLLANTNARSVFVIPNAVFLPLPKANPIILPKEVISEKKFILLAIGRLVPQKAFHRLIQAFADVSPSYPEWELIILGEGPLRSHLENQIRSLNIQSQVKLPGWAGNTADWYRAAQFLVMVSEFEGFPNVLIEAMAHGCPVVSVDCDTGPRDIVQNGLNGLLIAQNSHLDLKAALHKMMATPSLRNNLASHAKEITRVFSFEAVNPLWLRVFSKPTHQLSQDPLK